MQVNGIELTAAEAAVYGKAAGKSRLAYIRKHGGKAYAVPAGARVDGGGAEAWKWSSDAAAADVVRETAERAEAWEAAHRAKYDQTAHRAGVNAIRRMHRLHRDTAASQPGAPVMSPDIPRLIELGINTPAGRGTRKTAAPVETVETPAPVTVADVAAESDHVTIVAVGGKASRQVPAADVAPAAIVPDPMPTMTRAARKASNRELAERMRAAGLTPAGDAWRLASSGVPLEDIAGAVRQLESAAGAR